MEILYLMEYIILESMYLYLLIYAKLLVQRWNLVAYLVWILRPSMKKENLFGYILEI